MIKRFARRRLIVDWKLQGSLCAHGLLYGTLLLVTVSCGIFVPLLWNIGDAANLPNFEEQAIVLLYMHERFWLLALLCIGIIVLGAVRFSHRIAGPLVRYKRNLRLMAAGKLPPALRTRRGDYLQEEVRCLNAAAAGVAARVGAIRQAHLAVRHELQSAILRLPRQQVVQLDALVAAERELEAALGGFEVHDPGDDRCEDEIGQAVPALAGVGGEGCA